MSNYLKSKLGVALLACLVVMASFSQQATAAPSNLPPTAAQQQAMSPQQALERLKEGNQRFVAGDLQEYDFTKIRSMAVKGQYPFAFVLACVDSRSAPDITFDQPLGSIFIGRVAGNVVDANMLGSMEFATKYAGAKLIVVLGHTACGAVQGACQGVGESNLKTLLKDIKPAVQHTKQKHSAGRCNNPEFINSIAKQNVIDQVNNIYKDSQTIKNLVDQQKVLLVGAMHDLATGKVDFFYTFKPESSK